LYILLTALFFVLKTLVINLNDIGIFKNTNIFGINIIVNNHILMKLLIEYFGYIIFGIVYKIFFDKNNNNNIQANITLRNNISFIINKTNNQEKNQKIKLLLISSILFAIQLMGRTILNFGSVWMLDLWIFNIFFIYIFMKYFLHAHLYKHQIYALIFIFVINFILMITCSSIRYKGNSEYDEIKTNYGSYFYIVLFYFVFLILSACLTSSEVLQKKLMDIYYASPYTILYMFGIISGAFTFIAYIIVSVKSCGNPANKNVNFCTVVHKDYDNGNHFFDNFKIYILNMNNRLKENKTSFYLEILLVYPLYSFLCYIKYLYETLVVWHLNPNFVLLSDNIYYSIRKIITLILVPKDVKTYFKLLGEMLALIGYLFYLEVFEIKCCGLNKNTKDNIILRGINDINSNILNDMDNDDDNEPIYKMNNDLKKIDDKNSKETEMINFEGYMINI
jgi:hypothetical protein